jgi:hypothetical protein
VEVEVIRPGDRVFFEPGENHWHGAAPDRFMVHIAMQQNHDSGSPVTWGEHGFDHAAAEGESPYFCVFEADFDDAAAMSAGRGSPEGQAVRADGPNYATGGSVVLDYVLRGG